MLTRRGRALGRRWGLRGRSRPTEPLALLSKAIMLARVAHWSSVGQPAFHWPIHFYLVGRFALTGGPMSSTHGPRRPASHCAPRTKHRSGPTLFLSRGKDGTLSAGRDTGASHPRHTKRYCLVAALLLYIWGRSTSCRRPSLGYCALRHSCGRPAYPICIVFILFVLHDIVSNAGALQ